MPDANDVHLTEADRRALRAARAHSVRASVLLALALVAMIVAILATRSRQLDPGALLAVLLLCSWWLWLLRDAPRRWRAIGRDLARGHAATLWGVAGVRSRRGVGLIAPRSFRLLLGDRTFRISAAQADALREGALVEARYGPESGVLLATTGAAQHAEEAELASPRAQVTGLRSSQDTALTAREVELLRLIAVGHADKQIARLLHLEPATVRTYNSQLYAKLGARRRTEAVARARSLGLLTDVEH